MRHSGTNGRGLSTGDPTRRVMTRTRVVLMAVFGLLLAVLTPLVVRLTADAEWTHRQPPPSSRFHLHGHIYPGQDQFTPLSPGT